MGSIAITDMRSRRPTQVYSADFAKNGGFDGDGSEWTEGTGWSVTAGVATRTNEGVGSRTKQAYISADAQRILLSYEIKTLISGNVSTVIVATGGDTLGEFQNSLGFHHEILQSTAGITEIGFRGTSDFAGSIDNVTFRVITETFALGPELVQNGGFDVGVEGWIENDVNVALSSVNGQLVVATEAATWGYQSFPVGIGKTYTLSGDFVSKAGAGRVRIGTGVADSSYLTKSTTGEFSITFVATASEVFISLGNQSTGIGVVNIYDDFSAKEQLKETPIAETVLGASDTLAFRRDQNMILMLRNNSGGALTPKLDGSDDTSVFVPGIGFVSIANGYTLPSVANGDVVAVNIDSIKEFCKGTLTITGADAMTATCIRY